MSSPAFPHSGLGAWRRPERAPDFSASEILAPVRAIRGLDAHAVAQLDSLAQERDRGLFAEGLLQWASHQENNDHLDAALAVYTILQQEGMPDSVRSRALARRGAVLGDASFGDRVEFLSRRFARQATDPVMLAGMGIGSAVFAGTRTAILARALSQGGGGLIRSGFAARAFASGLAFCAEVPAFWGSTKVMNEWLHPGSQTWDARTNLREMLGLGLTLGALKLSGWGAQSLLARPAGATNPGALRTLAERALPQLAMYGGIVGGHALERSFGLREPVSGANLALDSLATLLQFHVGGRLSETALGPNFGRFSADMEARSRGFESRTGNASLWETLADRWQNLHGPVFSLIGGPRGTRPGDSMAETSPRPQDHILMMSAGKDGTGGSAETTPLPVNLPPARERGIRNDIATPLKVREGRTPDDRFEPAVSPAEILASLGKSGVVLDLVNRDALIDKDPSDLNEADLGSAIGEALNARLGQIAEHPLWNQQLKAFAEPPLLQVDFTNVPRFVELPRDLRDALDIAAELMQVTNYAIRSQQQELLSNARARISHPNQIVYQELLSVIRVLKGPRLGPISGEMARGNDVIGPELAVLSHGSGAMASLLRTVQRQIVPGGRPWWSRYFSTDADPRAVGGIRSLGKNPLLPANVYHNFEGDVPIEALHILDPLAAILSRRVQVQLLNVPSTALDKLMNETYIRGLPHQAILVSAIGGVVETKGGRPELPYEFFRGRLDRYGRSDVEIVSMAGYIPAEKLWNGDEVRINLSTRELIDGDRHTGQPREAANIVARLFGGPDRENDYVFAQTSHWDRSNNIGKVAKNVFTLMIGFRAGRIARDVVERQRGLAQNDPRFGELLQLGVARYHDAQKEIRQMVLSLLSYNEGIKPRAARYTQAVDEDFHECAGIDMPNLVEAFRAADRLNLQEVGPDQIRAFLAANIFDAPRGRRVATTRNPRYGAARALYEKWVNDGLPYNYEQVGPPVTVEGYLSLGPFVRYFSHPDRLIQRRGLPEAVYDLHEIILGTPVTRIPIAPKHLVWALEPKPTETEPRQLQEVLRRYNIDMSRIGQLLETANQTSFSILNREINRVFLKDLEVRRLAAEGSDALPIAEAEVGRRVEILKALEEALTRGNIVSITRSRENIGPYENAFIIQRQDPSMKTPTHQAFMRLNIDEVLNRLTGLGMFIRSFAPEDPVEIDVRFSGRTDSFENWQKVHDVNVTGRAILTAFNQVRQGALRMRVDGRPFEAETVSRPPPSDQFYKSLEPLARWVLGLSDVGPIRQEEVRELMRNPRHETSQVLDNIVRGNSGWVMLLSHSGGALQSGIRAMLTRPEKSSLIGIYDGDRLIDTIAVYRHHSNEARVLSHLVLKRFDRMFPRDHDTQRTPSIDYFEGLPVPEFLEKYRQFNEREGINVTRHRVIPIQSAPLEQALVGKVPGIHPAILKLYLLPEQFPERDELLREVELLYEMPPAEAIPLFQAIVGPRLDAFFEANKEEITRNPFYRNYQRFGFHRLLDQPESPE